MVLLVCDVLRWLFPLIGRHANMAFGETCVRLLMWTLLMMKGLKVRVPFIRVVSRSRVVRCSTAILVGLFVLWGMEVIGDGWIGDVIWAGSSLGLVVWFLRVVCVPPVGWVVCYGSSWVTLPQKVSFTSLVSTRSFMHRLIVTM